MTPSRALALRALLLALVLFGLVGGPASAQAPAPPPAAGQPPGAGTTDILFVLDSSASMSRDDTRGKASDPGRLRISALRAFVTLATPRMRLGLVNLSDAYSGNDGLDRPTALETGLLMPLTDASPQGRAQLLAALSEVKTTHEAGLEDGFTYMSRALDLARRVMAGSTAQQRYVVVLSDGDVTGEDPRFWWSQARELEASGTRFVIFRLGRREPPGLTNRELAGLNDELVPNGGGARVVDRPEELLGYYLQTFVLLSRDSYLNQLGPMGAGPDQPILNVQEWMDVAEIDLLVSGPGKPVARLVSDKLGRDVLPDARSPQVDDENLQVLTLSRERLGALEGQWKISLGQPAQDVQVVFRSRVAITPDPVLQPKDADQAVVSLVAQDGRVAVPKKSVVVRGAAGDESRPLLAGALAPDRYSGTVRPDRDGQFRVRVTGEVAGRADLPPWLEKAFPIGTTDAVGVRDVGLAFERVTAEKLLKAGQPLQVRAIAAGGRCAPTGMALKVDATYPTPPNGVPQRESGAAAQPLGQAPGGGLLYGFVPQAPGQISFQLDHAVVQCSGVELPIGVVAGGAARGTQTFDVEVERLLKVERESPKALPSIAPGVADFDVVIRYDLSSYRNERLVFGVQGNSGAVPIQPTVELMAREGSPRPQPRKGTLPIKLKFPAPPPGGTRGSFVLTVQGVDPQGATAEIGRFDYDYEIAAGVLTARLSREPQITRDGITLAIGIDPSRLVILPPATVQEFDVTVDGLKSARVEPKVVRAAARKELFEQIVFIQTEDVCAQPGDFTFKLGLRALPSPNGAVLVAGAPIEVSVPMPKMAVTMSAPERIAALRPGVALPITLQSTSLCQESMTLRVSEPANPTRFVESGVSAPGMQLGAGAGEVRTVALMPTQAAPRGESGTLVLEARRVAGHPSASYPEPLRVAYYTPLWTEENPDLARVAFLVIEVLATATLALPRTLFSDPIRAHRAGDSSVVSARKRFRWFVLSFFVSLAFASVAVYWAMARYMP